MRVHVPILKTIGATIGGYLVLVCAHLILSRENIFFSFAALLWFFAGLLYTHFFEYFYHNVLLHKGLPGFKKTLRKSHRLHHLIFHDDHFTSRKTSDLEEISNGWRYFPILLVAHYVLSLAFVPWRYTLILFAGILLHYLTYEITHWCTHVPDTLFDKIVFRIPLLRAIRGNQIKHHWLHHNVPTANYNFNPPYLGDIAGRTFDHKPLK